MKFDLTSIVVAGAMLFAAFGPSDLSFLGRFTPSVVTPVVDERVPTPSSEMQALVSPIVDIVRKGPNAKVDGQLMGNFFRDFAEVSVTNEKYVKTKGDVRAASIRAGQIMFQRLGIKGDYPGLAKAVDKAAEGALGLKEGELDPETRKKTVEVYKAVAWACYKGAEGGGVFGSAPDDDKGEPHAITIKWWWF